MLPLYTIPICAHITNHIQMPHPSTHIQPHIHIHTHIHSYTLTHTHQAQHTQTHTLTLLFSSRNTRCWLLMPISCLATDPLPSRWYPDVEEGTVVPWTLLALLYVAMLGIPLRELLKFSHLGIDPLGDVLGFGIHCRESLARLEGLPAAPGQ